MSYWNFMPSQERICIVNVKIFDGNVIKPACSVHIAEGKITAITGETTYSNENNSNEFPVFAHGGVLIPGLIDCHIHLLGVEQLEQLRAFGVTSACDLTTSPLVLLNAIRGIAGTHGLPAIKTAGVGAHYEHEGMDQGGRVRNEQEAKEFVAAQVSQGADYIKVLLDEDNPNANMKSFPVSLLRKIVHEAKRHHKMSICHATAVSGHTKATEAGFDMITHGPMDTAYSGDKVHSEILNHMYHHHTVDIPTVTLARSIVDRFAMASPHGVENVKSWVKAMHTKGIRILTGTDSNAASGVPGHTLHGESMHDELEYLVECGMTPAEALLSATKHPADVFGFKGRGEIKVGNVADLVLLKGDPLENIRNTRTIKQVWTQGIPVLPFRGLQIVPLVPWGYSLATRHVQDQAEKNGHTVVKPAPSCC